MMTKDYGSGSVAADATRVSRTGNGGLGMPYEADTIRQLAVTAQAVQTLGEAHRSFAENVSKLADKVDKIFEVATKVSLAQDRVIERLDDGRERMNNLEEAHGTTNEKVEVITADLSHIKGGIGVAKWLAGSSVVTLLGTSLVHLFSLTSKNH